MIETILSALLWLSGQVPDKLKPYVGGLLGLWILYSVVIGWLNQLVRARAEAGLSFGSGFLKFLAAANVPAINPDKAWQLWKGYRGPSQPVAK